MRTNAVYEPGPRRSWRLAKASGKNLKSKRGMRMTNDGADEGRNVPPMKIRVLRNFLKIEGLPTEIKQFLVDDLSRLIRQFHGEGRTLPKDIEGPPQSQGSVKKDLMEKTLARAVLCEVRIHIIEALANKVQMRMPPTDDLETLPKGGKADRR